MYNWKEKVIVTPSLVVVEVIAAIVDAIVVVVDGSVLNSAKVTIDPNRSEANAHQMNISSTHFSRISIAFVLPEPNQNIRNQTKVFFLQFGSLAAKHNKFSCFVMPLRCAH